MPSAESPFAFTPDDQAVLANLRQHFPEAITGLEAAVQRLVTQLAETFEGVIVSEARADEVLLGLLDRLLAQAAPDTDQPTDSQLMPGVMVSLVARSVLAEARDGFVARVVGSRQN